MRTIYAILFFVFIVGCKEKYVARVNTPPLGNLVVEGFINAGDSATVISLSRTTPLDSAQFKAETGAEVDIQSSGGQSFPLAEVATGRYSTAGIPVDLNQQYRLHIKTSGKEYMSDYEEAKLSPPIDSLSWNGDENSVSISVSTHDDTKKSVYYQWDCQETWQYSTPFTSAYILLGMGIVKRNSSQMLPQICWSSDLSTSINISSSEKLSLDQIYRFPLLHVDYSSEKLNVEYSVLVNQQVLTKDWYEWLQKLQKNTEELGSIFDAQPSDVTGNIHCLTDPSELTIGFIGCSSTSQKRIFIHALDVPYHVQSNGFEACKQVSLKWFQETSYSDLLGSSLEITDVMRMMDTITVVIAAPSTCIDCRLHGGSAVEPDFWKP